MSLLYKNPEDVTTSVHVPKREDDDLIVLEFYANCGKFGTDENLAGYTLTPKRLLDILSHRDDYTDEELE